VKRVLITLFCASTCAYGNAVLVGPTLANTPFATTTDFVSWAQLGTGATGVSFTAYSSDNESVTGTFTNGTSKINGTVVDSCTKNCGFTANADIASTDALILTGSGTSDSAPVSFSLPTYEATYGMGAYIEMANGSNADADTQFTIRIQAFAGVNSVLSSTSLVTSDAAGDPIFVGVSDVAKEITKVVYSLVDVNGNPIAGNFVVGKLYLDEAYSAINPLPQQSSVPEPGAMFLAGPALLALVAGFRKRSSRV